MMITMKKIIIALCCLLSFCTYAQEKPADKPTKKWYVNHTEIGVMMGRNNPDGFNRANLSLQTFNGYRLCSELAVGLTIGADWYTAMLISPVAVGVRYDLSKQKKVTPYLSLDSGYGSALLNKTTDNLSYKGGIMVNPAAGLKFRLSDETALVFNVGYKYQEASMVQDYGELTGWGTQYSETKYNFNRFLVRVGVSF